MAPFPRRPLTDGIPKPKRVAEVPGYLAKVIKGFFFRLFYILKQVWESAPHLLILMCVFCLLNGVLPVAGAYITKMLLDGIADVLTGNGSFTPIIVLLAVQFGYLFLQRVVQKVNSVVTNLAGDLVSNHIRVQIITKAKTVDQASFDRPEFYEKLENANREAGMRPVAILNNTLTVISTAIGAASFIAVLTRLDWFAPVVVALAALPGAAVSFVYRNKTYMFMRRHSKERREMNYYSGLMVNKDLVKEIKILGLGDTFIEKYNDVFDVYFKGQKKLVIKEGVAQLTVSLLSMLANAAMFAYVALRVTGVWTGIGNTAAVFRIGDYSLFSGALTSISANFASMVTATASIYEGTLFIDNMIAFMKEKTHVRAMLPQAKTPTLGVPHTLTFENVSFSYPGSDKKVLRDVNLTFRSGERTVLVGLNGAGKTTLIKLMTRLYDPTEGRILLDGTDIREFDPEAYYRMFGIIFQDFGKYAQTVRENIRFGDVDDECMPERIVEAAQHGDAESFIRELPKEYDTALTRMFEEDGVELSGGQWQKLSVARAFYKRSEFLILDEPTAALDPMAEQAVFRRFSELSEGKLSLFVSHRLSSATTADRIVVLDLGGVEECGTHDELMARKGKYYTLFSVQAKRYTGIDYDAEYAVRAAKDAQTDTEGDGTSEDDRPIEPTEQL